MTGGETTPAITAEIEDQVLDILDRTEPGDEREAALRALPISDSVRAAVTAWLAAEEPSDATPGSEAAEFLAPPIKGGSGADTPTSRRQLDTAALPRQQGNYELLSILGKGGMGIVYAARDLRLGRRVALKVLPDYFRDNPKRLQRFEREVRAIAALRHKSIVQVFEAGTLDNTPFYTMELVEGNSLEKVIHRLRDADTEIAELRRRHWLHAVADPNDDASDDGQDRPYIEAACRLVIDIADALQHAHDKKILHRDVKPSNIMVPWQESAKLFDFGLARLEDDTTDAAVTRTSEVIGSPHYMSPEQIGGKTVDYRTDIYSLGVTLYELLTLRVPFAGTSPQQIYQAILAEEPPRPSSIHPSLPRDLETICLTATEKRADRRYQTAGEFAADLRRFLRFEPVLARPIGSLTRSVRWFRRNLAATVIVVLALASVVSVVAIIAIQVTMGASLEQAESQELLARNSAKAAIAERQRAAQETRKAEQRTAAAEHAATVARQAARTAEAQTSQLDDRILILQGDEQRAKRQTKEARRQADEHAAQLRAIQVKLTSERQQFARKEAANKRLEHNQAKLTSSLERLADDKLAIEKQFGTLAESLQITTINRLLMEASTLRTDNPGLGLLLANEAARLASAVEQARGTRIDVSLPARVDDTLLELLRTTQEERTFTKHDHPLTAVAFAPSGRRLVSASADGTVHIWARSTGRIHETWPNPARTSIVHAEFLADGIVLLADEVGTLTLWTPGASAPIRSMRRIEGLVHQASVRRHIGPQGEFLVGHSADVPGQLLVVSPPIGQTPPVPRVLGDLVTRIRTFEFSPAHRQVAAITATNRVQVYELDHGQTILDESADVTALALAFDAIGRRLAWLEANGTIRVIDITDGKQLLDARIDDDILLGTGRIAFCDDDRHLLVTGTGSPAHYLLHATDGRLLARLAANDDRRDFTLAPPDHKLACIADHKGGFYLFHTANGAVITRLNGHTRISSRYRPEVAFSPLGHAIATVHGDTTVRLWRTAPGGALTTLGAGLSDLRTARAQHATAPEVFERSRFEVGGEHVLVVSNRGVSRWHIRTGRRVENLTQIPHVPTNSAMLCASGGTAVAITATVTGRRIVRLGTDAQRFPLPTNLGHRKLQHITCWPPTAIAMTLSGTEQQPRRQLAILSEPDGTLRHYVTLPDGLSGGGLPAPSPDGRKFVVGYDDLWVVDLAAPDRPVRLPHSQRPSQFSPDGRWIAASTGFSVVLWDSATGSVRCELDRLALDYSQLTDLRFGPDSRELATAWSDGFIRIHHTDRQPGQLRLSIKAHDKRIHSIEFSRDGRFLVSASDDQTAKIWWTATGERRLTFRPGKACRFATFDAASARVLVVCEDAVHAFPLALRRLVRDKIPRLLTAPERQRFGLR